MQCFPERTVQHKSLTSTMAKFPLLLACLTTLLALSGLPGCSERQTAEKFLATDISGMDIGGDFTLTDHNGKLRSLSEFKGKAVVLLFGYTHCPDVCPTTLSEMTLALKQLGTADAQRVQVLFITLDPERDTTAVLAQYVPSFNPAFLGLRGDAAETIEMTRRFKVFAQKHDTGSNSGYTLDHSASSFVFDTTGKLRLLVGFGQGPEAVAHDLKLLLH
jgi:protein SCO1